MNKACRCTQLYPCGGLLSEGHSEQRADLERFPSNQTAPVPSSARLYHTRTRNSRTPCKKLLPATPPLGAGLCGQNFFTICSGFSGSGVVLTSCRRDGGQFGAMEKGANLRTKGLVLFVMCRCPCPVGIRHLPAVRRQEPERWRGQRRFECSKRLRR